MKSRAVSVALWAVLALAALLVAGPVFEARYFPVLTDAEFAAVSHIADRMTIDWTAVRHRGECKFEGAEAEVWRLDRWHTAILSRSGDATDAPLPGVTRPPGFQRFSQLDVIPDGSALRMTLRHRCHPLWTTVTRLPPAALR